MAKMEIELSGGPFGGQVSTWDVPDEGITDGFEDVVEAGDGLKYRYRYVNDSTRPDRPHAVFVGVEK